MATKRNMSGLDRKRRKRSLRKRDGDLCYLCGFAMNFVLREDAMSSTIDHVIALSEGGSNRLENLKLAHKKCNNGRHALPKKKKEKQ